MAGQRYDGGAFLKELCRALELSLTPKLIRSNTNLIYDCDDWILRLTPNSFRSADEVKRELHWMAFVGTQTDDVVQVIQNGSETTRQFICGDESFTAVRLEKIEGRTVQPDDWNAKHFEQLGELTASLHRIGQDYAPRKEDDLLEWDEVPEVELAKHLPADDLNLPNLNQAAFDYLQALPRTPGTYGPLHCDIHAGNYLLTEDDRIMLFDFENSCRGHYINDMAVVLYYARLNKLSGEDTGFAARFQASFWKGYAKGYPVPEQEVHHIPWLLLNRGLTVYSYMLKIWPDERTPEQAAYMQRVEDGIIADSHDCGLSG